VARSLAAFLAAAFTAGGLARSFWIFADSARLSFQRVSSSRTCSASRDTTCHTNAATDCPRMAEASFRFSAVASGKRGLILTVRWPVRFRVVLFLTGFMVGAYRPGSGSQIKSDTVLAPPETFGFKSRSRSDTGLCREVVARCIPMARPMSRDL
jgi:hypothetical protein